METYFARRNNFSLGHQIAAAVGGVGGHGHHPGGGVIACGQGRGVRLRHDIHPVEAGRQQLRRQAVVRRGRLPQHHGQHRALRQLLFQSLGEVLQHRRPVGRQVQGRLVAAGWIQEPIQQDLVKAQPGALLGQVRDIPQGLRLGGVQPAAAGAVPVQDALGGAQGRPVSQYQREGDAAYLSLLTTDLRTLYDDYYMSLFNIAFWGGIMLCALGMYLYISPVMLAAILLVTVPPLVLPRKMNERLKASRDAFSLQMAGYTQQLKELLGGFEVIRGFLREDAYAARHRDAARQARDSEQAYQQSLNAMVVNTSLISNLIFPIVMLVGLFLAFDGRLTMGTVSTAASMANFVITPCNQIAQCWAKVRSSKGIRQRLEAAMSGPEKVSAGRAIGKLEHIECKDTGFSYPGAAAPVLRGVRLTVSGQEKAVLVGESGCGKSTLAKLLFQYYPDYTGSILFNGQQLRDIDRQSLYQRVGYIAQTTYLFNDTLRSNICLGADFPEAQLSHAIGMAGLADWVSTLPDGLDTLISENGKNLSGGQRQRIGIARLALRRYDLIIADEITASLDPDTSGQVMENLLALPCMVVAITHDVSGAFMKQFDKVYRVEHGSVTQA